MATIYLSKKALEKEIKLTNDVLEKMRLFGTPVEIKDDFVYIEITPNRPDLLSHQGFLRAFKSFLGKPISQKYKINKPEKNYEVKINNNLKDIRPFTACAIVKNLKFNDEKIKEVIDIQEKLHATLGRGRKKVAIGIYPLEKITLPIKFEARTPDKIKFIPLEMKDEMDGLQILKRHPAGKLYANLLQNKKKFPVFVDTNNKILSMPPIINSHEIGKITDKTNDVFIECSGFDFQILKKTLNIIVTMLADMGGKIYAMNLDYGKKEITPDFTQETVKISFENTNNLLGLNLKEKDLEKLLPRMGYEYKNAKVKIPAWRTDILHEVDIIEDIAIAYGYDKFVPEVPKVATIGEQSDESKFHSKISEILIGLGLLEISTYHLIKETEANLHKITEENRIELLDSKTEYKILRPNLLISTLRILSENKDNEYPQKVFEIGKVFKKNSKSETSILESMQLSIAITPSNFTDIKQVLDYLTKSLDMGYSLKESKKEGLIDGRTGSILINGKEIGCIGEVHPETLHSWNLKLPVSILEISLDEIINKFKQNQPK